MEYIRLRDIILNKDDEEKFKNEIKNLERLTAIRSRMYRMQFCIDKLLLIKDNLKLEAINRNSEEIKEYLSLSDAFIISYGSIFANSRQCDHLRFNEAIFNDDNELKKFHKNIIQQRNKVVAHHDFSDPENFTGDKKYIECKIRPRLRNNKIELEYVLHYHNSLFKDIEEIIINYIKLFNKVLGELKRREKEIIDRLKSISNKDVKIVT